MARPKFPTPYTPLTSEIISRINSDIAYYDENPERAEREQRARKERDREERERQERGEEEYYRRYHQEFPE